MAIDTDTTKNSLFGSFKQAAKLQINENVAEPGKAKDSSTIELVHVEMKQPQEVLQGNAVAPKWQTLDKVTVLLTSEQKEGLDRVAKKLMRFRSKKVKGQDKERITANTLMRAIIDNFLAVESATPEEILISEEDVCRWVQKVLEGKSGT